MILIDAKETQPQPWKNGGGSTRELFVWPSEDWQLRVSVAEIALDGPFSAYPDVERWFAVVEGAGVVLRFGDDEVKATQKSDPITFAGSSAPDCRLIDGPTRDLNLMSKRATATMVRARYGVPWTADHAQCGLFAMKGGVWSCGGVLVDVPPESLLWMESSPTAPQLFKADYPMSPRAWWMGFTPQP